MSEYVSGTVKWFDSKKGYGFIVYNGSDFFLHSKRLRESNFPVKNDAISFDLAEGDKVKFRIAQGPKGPYAVEITKA